MKNIKKPNEPQLFDAYNGMLHHRFVLRIDKDWPGVMRRILLELMPAHKLGEQLSENFGRPSKELYSMAGLIFLAESFGWSHEEAADKYSCDMRLQYALNLGHCNQYLSERTYENYLMTFREKELAQQVFDVVTLRLVQELGLEIKNQRLDSTHVFSDMARFGRTKLMSKTVCRFLHDLSKHAVALYALVDEALRARYAQSDVQMFGMGRNRKSQKELEQLRQQIAQDMHGLIQQFDALEEIAQRSSYQALKRVFDDQCVVADDKISVVDKADSRCMQNPSDPDATYDGHKGTGYQAQIAETFGDQNEVNLITAVIPETAADQDADAVIPVVEQLEQRGLKPEVLVADGAYGSDENVLAAEKKEVELIAPVKGVRKDLAGDHDAQDAPMHALDFTRDEQTGEITCCPMGQKPLAVGNDGAGRYNAIFDARQCRQCPRQQQCPTARGKTQDRVDYIDKELRLEMRRRREHTAAFKDVYRCRAGIEGTMSALKRGLGLGRLTVRGRSAVNTAICLKAAAYNMKQAARALGKRAKRPVVGVNPGLLLLVSPWYALWRRVSTTVIKTGARFWLAA